MGWASYEIPDLEVKGKIELSAIYEAICDNLVYSSSKNENSEDEASFWEELRRVLVLEECIEEDVSAEAVAEAIKKRPSRPRRHQTYK